MESILKQKSYSFALRIIKLYKFLIEEKKEYILSKQVLKSGTSIGALISEAAYGQSKADFISKMSIAIKEANETNYWLSLLKDSEYIDENAYKSISNDCIQLLKILTKSINTAKKNQ